jgi:hypothetical protein
MDMGNQKDKLDYLEVKTGDQGRAGARHCDYARRAAKNEKCIGAFYQWYCEHSYNGHSL